MNSMLKRKMHKGSRINTENCITQKQETKITIKELLRIDDILGKT